MVPNENQPIQIPDEVLTARRGRRTAIVDIVPQQLDVASGTKRVNGEYQDATVTLLRHEDILLFDIELACLPRTVADFRFSGRAVQHFEVPPVTSVPFPATARIARSATATPDSLGAPVSVGGSRAVESLDQ
jgi:hypothetical protein